MHRSLCFPKILAILVCCAVSLSGRPTYASPVDIVNLTVTTNVDDIGKVACVTGPLDCSLRGAIQYVNTNSAAEPYTINLPVGTFTLTGDSGEDANASGDLDLVDRQVTLTGMGDTTILDGNNLDRVLDIHSGTVSLEHLMITHGNVATGSGGGGGIKIHYGSTVQLNQVTVVDNFVDGVDYNKDQGGGILNSGSLVVRDSSINDNTAFTGGGLCNAYDGHPLTLEGVHVDGNHGSYGGGIAFFGPGPGYIHYSTLHDNTGDSGGGLYNYGTLTLDSDTIDGNHAPFPSDFGGGVHNRGDLTLRNVTIAGNDAYNAGGFAAINGSSATFNHCTFALNTIHPLSFGTAINISTGAPTTFHNTIITSDQNGNTCSLVDGAQVTDLGYNLSSDHSCGFSTVAPYYDLIDIAASAVFSPVALGDYGGLTLTIQLFAHGPAVDTADPNSSLPRDQRGYFRPMFGRSDIGALEWDSVLLPPELWFPILLRP